MKKVKAFLLKYKHGALFSYFIIYLIWFRLLETRTDVTYYVVHTKLDNYIPFNELFAIPYFIWFGYIAYVLLYLCFKSKQDFYKACAYLFTGMSICLLIYSIWPTMQDLRPAVMPRQNILTWIISWLYSIDSCTNVCPSIHVFNAVGCAVALLKTERFKHSWRAYVVNIGLAVMITLSTMFIKQHSVYDVFWALILCFVLYVIVYVPDYSRIFQTVRVRAENKT